MYEQLLDKLAIFILTHDRPFNQRTFNTLKRLKCEADIYLIVDDEDPSLETYKKRFNNLLIFNKDKIKKEMNLDMGDNFNNYLNCIIPRNYCFKIAKELGYDYFLELDDDYNSFDYRYPENGQLKADSRIPYFNEILNATLNLLEEINADAVAFMQGGDFIGGLQTYKHSGFKRKIMNSIFFKTDNDLRFKGSLNDDVTMYVLEGHRGRLFFSLPYLEITQETSQASDGGLTEAYAGNTYIKSFYSVMYSPSNTKIHVIGSSNYRIHHSINWNNTAPKILKEEVKK